MRCSSGAQTCQLIGPLSCLRQITRAGAVARPTMLAALRISMASKPGTEAVNQ